MVKKCLGIDIGGANIKVADTLNYARSWPFAMWNCAAELPGFLEKVLREAPPGENLAVTMTGELADCFSSKAEGVNVILDAVDQAAKMKTVRVYQVSGQWATVEEARSDAWSVAAANWHAMARFVARAAGGPDMLLVDVGSTTTDLVPIIQGMPCTQGQDDVARLQAGELVYTGVERTPVCALVDRIPYRNQECRLAAELFATTLDVYLVLGNLPESEQVEHTGDGQVRSRSAARTRLARMICADPEQFSMADARRAAEWIAAAQARLLADCLDQVVSRWNGQVQQVVVSGHGDFLARHALAEANLPFPVRSLTEEMGRVVSRSGPAHALAVLATEEWVV